MSPLDRKPSPPVPERAWAEAAAWVVKLHGPNRDAALESGWRRWLAEDPDHAFAWELASDTWNKSHDVAAELVRPPVPDRRKRFHTWIVPTAVTIGICGLVMVGWALHLFGQSDVTTGIGEQRTLNLRDGTRVELNTNSRLLVKYDRHVRRVILKSGEAFFAVTHEERPFVVMAGDRKIIAVGTSFLVRRDGPKDESVTVTLIEGRVAVAPIGAADVLSSYPLPDVTVLNSGQRLHTRRHAAATVDAPPMDRATGWMRGQLVFDHTALKEAAAELNRYSTLRISVASPTAQIPVGGIFRVGDSVSFARAVAESYHLRLTQRGDELLLEPEEGDSPPAPTPPNP